MKHLSVIKYENSKYVPGWVIGRNVELDGYHTDPKIAKKCFSLLKKILRKEKVKLKDYTFLEPSAGSGSFYDLLPAEKRIGVDIEKYNGDYIIARTYSGSTWSGAQRTLQDSQLYQCKWGKNSPSQVPPLSRDLKQ